MAEALNQRTGETYRRCLIFSLNKSVYGIEATDALQIVRHHALVSVPGTAPTIAGALAFRQEVYGILKLSQILGVQTQGEEWIILLRHPHRRVGIAVSSVVKIERVRASSLSRDQESGLLRDIVTEGETIPFLNIAQLINQF